MSSLDSRRGHSPTLYLLRHGVGNTTNKDNLHYKISFSWNLIRKFLPSFENTCLPLIFLEQFPCLQNFMHVSTTWLIGIQFMMIITMVQSLTIFWNTVDPMYPSQYCYSTSCWVNLKFWPTMAMSYGCIEKNCH